jgi:glycosyltransferase involved in cell wall biosynthesis
MEFDASAARPILQTQVDGFGGAERAALGLADWLYEQGLPAYFLTYEDKCGLAGYAKHPLTVVELTPGGRSSVEKVAALREHLRARGVGAPRLLCSGYPASLHATRAGERGFHTLMHDTPSLFSDAANRSWKNHLRLAVTNRTQRKGLGSGGVTIVTSEHLKADCRKYFGVEAVIQRMGGMTLAGGAAAGSHQWKDGETLRLLSVCRIEESKRIDWLLEGLAELKPAVDWRLDLAGKGPQIEALREMAERLGIGGRVHFLGFVPDEALEALYGRAHLFLMPALQGYGIPAVEALSRGIPVVVHRESGVSDVLLDTPWATVLFGGRESTAGALAKAIDGVMRGVALGVERPVLPTEAEWAEGVARLCGWV